MTRSALLVVFLAACTLACGAEPIRPAVHVDLPAASESSTPFPLAIVRGRIEHADSLIVELTRPEDVVTFEASRGRWLAFTSAGPEGSAASVTWFQEGTDGGRSSGLAARVGGLGLEEVAVLSGDGRAVVIDAEAETVGDAASLIRSMEDPGGDLRLLLVVQPSTPSWKDTPEALQAYKEAEVETYLKARRSGDAYTPSREDLLVLPKQGKDLDTLAVDDFQVLRWPDPAYRVDGTWIESPRVTMTPAGRPAVTYKIAAERQDAFEAWTKRSVGSPLAIVVDGRVVSSPTIQSALRDSVMITLGSGASVASTREQASRMATALAVPAAAPSARLAALISLDESGSFELALPLTDDGVEVRLRAVDVAGRESAEVSRTIRHRPNVEMEVADRVAVVLAALALGLVQDDAAAATLRPHGEDALRELERQVRRADLPATRRLAATRLLGLVDPASTVGREALYAVLADPGLAHAHGAAAEALLREDAERTATFARLLAHPDSSGAVLPTLLEIFVEDEAAMLDVVLDGTRAAEPLRRRRAASLLANVEAAEAGDALLRLLEDSDADVRRTAAQGLTLRGQLRGGHSGVPLDDLVRHLDDPRVEIRTWAAVEMGLRGESGRPHAPRLRELLDDPESDVRQAAAWGLVSLGVDDARARAILDEVLRAADPPASGE